MERARWYSKQIMISLGGGEKYRNFLTALRDFKDGKISDTEVVSRVKELLHDHHYLLHGLSFFLQTTLRTDTYHHSPQRKQFGDGKDSQIRPDAADNHVNEASSTSQPITVEADEGSPSSKGQFSDDEVSQIHQITEFLNKVRERFNDDNGAYKYFLDIIGRYKEEDSQVGEEIKRLFKNYPDLYIDFTRFEADCYTTVGTERLSKFKKRGKTDESNHKKLNSYEKMMFDRQDNQVALDTQLNRLESAIINMTEFLEVVKETGAQIDVKRYLTPLDLLCIEKTYGCKDGEGGYGLGAIDLLCAFPVDASTSILDRLIQKYKELEELRRKVNRVLANVYNYRHDKRGKNYR